MYNAQMLLHSYYTTCNGLEYISTTFNIRIRRAIHIICVYRSHSSFISMFLNTLQMLIQKSPNDCPLIILGNFNIDILDDNNHENNTQQSIDFMNKLELKSQFKNITTKVGSQLNHIWSNVLGNECKSSVSKAYWLDFHKPIYITFTLQDTLKIFIFIKDNISWHSHMGKMEKDGKRWQNMVKMKKDLPNYAIIVGM